MASTFVASTAVLTLAISIAALPSGTLIAPDAASAAAAPEAGESISVDPAADRVATTTARPGSPRIRPGGHAVRTITISNTGSEPAHVDIAPARVAGSTSGDVVDILAGDRSGAAGWVTLSQTEAEIASGARIRVRVTIDIPEDARPGSSPVAIVVTSRAPDGTAGGAGITTTIRRVSILVVDLPGPARLGIDISDPMLRRAGSRAAAGRVVKDADELEIVALLRNTGDRVLTTTGRVELRGLRGARVAGARMPPGTVYPDGTTRVVTRLDDVPLVGIYTPRVVVRSDAGTLTAELPRVLIVPTWLVLAVATLLAAAVGAAVAALVRRRRGRRAQSSQSSQSPQT